MKNPKEYFEANLLDGQKIEDTGDVMIRADYIWGIVEEMVATAWEEGRKESKNVDHGNAFYEIMQDFDKEMAEMNEGQFTKKGYDTAVSYIKYAFQRGKEVMSATLPSSNKRKEMNKNMRTREEIEEDWDSMEGAESFRKELIFEVLLDIRDLLAKVPHPLAEPDEKSV